MDSNPNEHQPQNEDAGLLLDAFWATSKANVDADVEALGSWSAAQADKLKESAQKEQSWLKGAVDDLISDFEAIIKQPIIEGLHTVNDWIDDQITDTKTTTKRDRATADNWMYDMEREAYLDLTKTYNQTNDWFNDEEEELEEEEQGFWQPVQNFFTESVFDINGLLDFFARWSNTVLKDLLRIPGEVVFTFFRDFFFEEEG